MIKQRLARFFAVIRLPFVGASWLTDSEAFGFQVIGRGFTEASEPANNGGD